jgi:hypothetical protein
MAVERGEARRVAASRWDSSRDDRDQAGRGPRGARSRWTPPGSAYDAYAGEDDGPPAPETGRWSARQDRWIPQPRSSDDTDYRIKRFVDDTGDMSIPPQKPGQGQILDHDEYWSTRRVNPAPPQPGDPYWGSSSSAESVADEFGNPYWGDPRPAPPQPPRFIRRPPASGPRVSAPPMSPPAPPMSPPMPPMSPTVPPMSRPRREPLRPEPPPRPQPPPEPAPPRFTDYRRTADQADYRTADQTGYGRTSDQTDRRTGDPTDWRPPRAPDDWRPSREPSDWRPTGEPSDWRTDGPAGYRGTNEPSDWRPKSDPTDWRRTSEQDDWRRSSEQTDWRTGEYRWGRANDLYSGVQEDEDDEEDEEEEPPGPRNYVYAALAALGWFIIPVAIYLGYAFLLNDQPPPGCNGASTPECLTPRAEALQNLFGNVPLVTITVSVSILIALVLRKVASGWRTLTVGFASAVVGSGAATVLFTVVSN